MSLLNKITGKAEYQEVDLQQPSLEVIILFVNNTEFDVY